MPQQCFSPELRAFYSIQANQLCVSANVVGQVSQSNLTARPLESYTPQKDSIHGVFHEAEHMLDQGTDFGFLPIVTSLGFAQWCPSTPFFTHLVFDIQVLQNPLDFLACVGSISMQRLS